MRPSHSSFVVLLTSCLFILTLSGITAWGQSNPTPLINLPLVPDAVAAGSSAFSLIVKGTGFVSGSTVYWNGSALTPAYLFAAAGDHR